MVGKPMKEISPFDLHAHGGGGFVTFEVNDAVALPLLALAKATLRSSGARQIVILEFDGQMVTIEGAGLLGLFDHLLAGRIKAVRTGHYEECVVDRLHLAET